MILKDTIMHVQVLFHSLLVTACTRHGPGYLCCDGTRRDTTTDDECCGTLHFLLPELHILSLVLACSGEGICFFHENIVDVAVPLDSQLTVVIFDGLHLSIGVIHANNDICIVMTRQDHRCHLVRIITTCV